jgi:hypothetical protein
MIGSLELYAFLAVGTVCFITGVHYERYQVRKEQKRGYDPKREWN